MLKADEIKLQGVHDDLVNVVRRAWFNSGGGFAVGEGLRSKERQIELYNAGASQIRDGGRHVAGKAVDLLAKVGTEVRWDWPLYFILADHMALAARQLGIRLRWGGCWDRETHLWTGKAEEESEGYVQRKRSQGERPFMDGPHFELPVAAYP